MPDRPIVVGIVNVTPDSFSDGGRYTETDTALAHALRLVEQGADWIDVGGESTRPGADRVPAAEEQRRVLPVVTALAERGIRVSIDTMSAATARVAVHAGAGMVNDVSGWLADPDMASVVAEADVPFVLMHWRGHSADMASRAVYRDVVAEVRDELADRVGRLTAEGVRRERLLLDPGIGFAKDGGHNWQVLANLRVLRDLGLPLYVGVSRKRFLGALPSLAGADAEARDLPTAVVSALLAVDGVAAVRVHDVASTVTALEVVAAWQEASA